MARTSEEDRSFPKLDAPCLVSGRRSSPCTFQKILVQDVENLRDAGFLFMRKVSKDAVLVDYHGREMSLSDNFLPLMHQEFSSNHKFVTNSS